MKSTYAPLPFSYLSSDAKPKVGLRKDGVYGTSADFVPRSTNQVEGADAGDISMATQYPYSVYANANALNPEGTAAADHRGNQHHHQQTAADHHPPYSQNGAGLPRFQEATSHRPQKPEGGFQVYPPSSKYDEPPSSGRVSPKEVDLERKGDHEYRGLPVVKRTHEQLDRSNAAVGRVPSYYPPMGNNFDRQVNGVESPYTYTLEHPKEKQQPTTTAVMAKDFDNFILVKDPNRPDSVVVIPEANPSPSSANNDPRRNNNLQTLFEAGEPPRKQQLPRYNTQQPENHYDISGPSRGEDPNTRHNQEVSGSDRSNYAIYHGHAQQPGPEFVTAATTKPEPPIYNGSAGVMQPDNHHRSSDTRLVKDSDSGSSSTSGCCVCGKCASVVIAIIVTAIICLGAGFVAGWFGARAAGNDTSPDSSPSQLIFANLSTVTTTMAERVSTTKPSVTSSSKAPAIPSSSKLLAISSAKAQQLQVTSTIERRAAISTTGHSGQ